MKIKYECEGDDEGEACTKIFDSRKNCMACETQHEMNAHIAIIQEPLDRVHTISERLWLIINCTPKGIHAGLDEIEAEIKEVRAYVTKNIPAPKKRKKRK